MKRFLNNKGSALVLVMSSLIILTAVGAVVIFLSVANISMSTKYSNWSAEYYTLDYAAQNTLADFDNAVLIPAETTAREYLQNSDYLIEAADYDAQMPAEMKSFISPNLHEVLYQAWAEIDSAYTIDDEESQEYKDAVKAFVNDAFTVLYHAYVNTNIGSGITATMALVDAGSFPDDGDIPSETLSSLAALVSAPQVRVTETDSDSEKKVTALATIAVPSYYAVEQTRYVPVFVNPLYTNAISARGAVIFTGSADITGDIVSNNVGHSDGLEEGNQSGVIVRNSADVTVQGNISCAGDVHLWGAYSSLDVGAYPITRELKALLFQNDYGYDTAVGYVPGVAEDNPVNGVVPFIYLDNDGGNVYCNNLSVESGATSGDLSVSGHVWTQDDIQNDATGSRITVDGNFIGLSSDSEAGDPNRSSAVINNAYASSGSIWIGGDYIIPGTAWYKFTSKGTYNPSSSPAYYQTGQSGYAQSGEYFQIYFAQDGDVSATYFDAADESFDLFESNDPQDKIARFLSQVLASFGSGIYVDSSADRYLLGGLVDDTGSGSVVSSSGDITNGYNYNAYKDSLLPAVFQAKTENFGAAPEYTFDNLINPAYAEDDASNGFYYVTGGYYNLSGDVNGIIYAPGNLTIGGSGTLYGSVICGGDLTVSSGVDITYDETAIKNVLGVTDIDTIIESGVGSRIARRFFAPEGYALGQSMGVEEISSISTNSGERAGDEVGRYTINSWRESSQA